MAIRLDLGAAVRAHAAVILDTDFLIHELHGRAKRLSEIPSASRRTTMVSLWEFLHVSEGITLSREQRRTRRSWLDDHGILVLDIGKNTSQSFRVLAELDQTPHGVADCLIAAECIARGFPLVTYNVRHFAVLENLHLVPLAPLR